MKKSYVLLLLLFSFIFVTGALYQRKTNTSVLESDQVYPQNSDSYILNDVFPESSVASSINASKEELSGLIKPSAKVPNINILAPTEIVCLDDWSVKIEDKTYFSRYEDIYIERADRIDTDRYFQFFWKNSLGVETKIDIPFSISYINHVFQNFPVTPYPTSELGNALIMETLFGKIVITVDVSNYARVEGLDSYNYYMISDGGELLRLNNNAQDKEIAFHGMADLGSGEIFYLQSPRNTKNRALYSVDLSNKICKELVSDVAEYVLVDNVFFTKYSAVVSETISDEFYENVGIGLYEYDRQSFSIRELLPLSEYIVTNFIASNEYLFINVCCYGFEEDDQCDQKSILYDRNSETFLEFNGVYLFPVFAEEGVLCFLDYDQSKQALISYDGEVTIWGN